MRLAALAAAIAFAAPAHAEPSVSCAELLDLKMAALSYAKEVSMHALGFQFWQSTKPMPEQTAKYMSDAAASLNTLHGPFLEVLERIERQSGCLTLYGSPD